MSSRTSSGDLRSPDDSSPASSPHPAFPQLIEAVARRIPHAPALVSEGEHGFTELTYGELQDRVDEMARGLRSHGVGPETVVSLLGERTPELISALLAISAAGGAYHPLDPDDPPARHTTLLEDVRPPFLLVDASSAERLPSLPAGTRVLALDGLRSPRTATPSDAKGGPPGSGRALAYVIHTSGSSGRPKGVMVEHRSVLSRLVHGQEVVPIHPEDVVLQKTSLGYDASVREIFGTLMVGATLVLARPGGHRDPSYLADLVSRRSVTVLNFVPSMLRIFLEVNGVGEKCRSVRLVLSGGEPLPYELTRRFYRVMPEGAELHNLYGPTEGTVTVTHWPVPREPVDETVPIGRPIGGVQMYVMDGERAVTEPGVEGELYIGGVQVARGYLNRPDLTADRFPSDPFSSDPEARMYRTGDRGRWRADGNLEFLGRLDRQGKVRGVRVEPSEVESALMRTPGVREAVVVLREDAPGESRLIAYVVPDKGVAVDVSRLRESVAGLLPEAIVPSRFTLLEELPRGPGGKLDASRLPAPGSDRPTLATPYVAPRDEMETFLADLWSRELGVEPIGIQDPFFELGGTSLHAARIVSRVAERMKEPVHVVTLFVAPTISAYADFLRAEYGADGDGGVGSAAARPSRIDAEAVARFHEAVPHHVSAPPEASEKPEGRNPPALFILAPPRSGTTLLRVMLAGHSGIFAAPELQLLNFETLRQRRDAFSGTQRHWLEGTVRSVMELMRCGPDEAWALMAAHEDEGMTTAQFYRLLQERAAPRLLADKTPAYALEPEALCRAESIFHDPLYVHLVRHPVATVRSFRERRLEQLLFMREHDFSPAELAELVWLGSHRTVVEFLSGIPRGRWARIRFEDLVHRPEQTLEELCQRLGITYESAMAEPYRELDRKMVDGVHPESAPMGDQHLLRKDRVDPSAASRRLIDLRRADLSPLTWELAQEFGYEPPEEKGSPHVGRDGRARPGTDASEERGGGSASVRARLRLERLAAMGEREERS